MGNEGRVAKTETGFHGINGNRSVHCFTTSLKALPTDIIISAAKACGVKNAKQQPVKKNRQHGRRMLGTQLMRAEDSMAKPPRIIAVAFPALSRAPVRSQTLSSRCPNTGPKALVVHAITCVKRAQDIQRRTACRKGRRLWLKARSWMILVIVYCFLNEVE